MDRRTTAVTIACVLLLLGLYPVSGIAIKKSREAAFETTKIGDSYDEVVGRFGSPSEIDGQGQVFTRYSDKPCELPCVKRLWFENRLFLDVEAWSVSFGKDDKVVEKYHWVSP